MIGCKNTRSRLSIKPLIQAILPIFLEGTYRFGQNSEKLGENSLYSIRFHTLTSVFSFHGFPQFLKK